jgi:uroporphyrinogen decarboxylase
MKACRREPTDYTPVWLMRQAGRYLPEYRAIRTNVSMLELCKRPDLASEVTVMAVERLGVDAAIIFSDLLLILEPMGLRLEYTKDEGPRIRNPVRSPEDIGRLKVPDPGEFSFVLEAIRMTRQALRPTVPLIGFAGAPFTLASYMIEGSGSKSYQGTKALMFGSPSVWQALMEVLCRTAVGFLNAQIAAGAQAVQLFDSWAGCLSPATYREFVLPHVKYVIDRIAPGTPVISFMTGNPGLLEAVRDAGGDVIGLDFRVDLDEAWARLGNVGVQGNLDPCALLCERPVLLKQAQDVLGRAGGRPGHIFNLGHGVLPETPVDNVLALVEHVHAAG